MYIYFDQEGRLKEIVNSSPIRQNSDNENKLYIYLEGDREPLGITLSIKVNDSDRTTYDVPLDLSECVEEDEIPYNEDRTLKYFKYLKTYKFYTYELTSEDTAYSGSLVVQPIFAFASGRFVLGKIALVVENSNVQPTSTITKGEYVDLLDTINRFNGNRISDINALSDDVNSLDTRVEALETKYLYRHSLNISLQGAVSVWVDIYTRNSDRLDNSNAFYQQLMTYGSVPCYENTFRIVNNNTIRSITRLRAIQGDSTHVKVSYYDITFAIVDGALQISHTYGEEDMQILTFYNDIINRIY